MTPADRSSLARRLAHACGFDAVGVCRTEPSPRAAYYRNWLATGHAGTMRYLHENAGVRENPAQILPGVRSVICVAMNYYRPQHSTAHASPASVPTGRVAQYARGRDYHQVLRARLGRLESGLRAALREPFDARACVDTAPVIERELAAAAGVGWIGKNTLVLNASLGSFTFLGELFTTLDMAPDAPATDHCGSCTRCLDACPTGALTAPYEMDASRCISYLTIEHRGEFPAGLTAKVGDWVYGCDVCQDVCPFNRHAPAGRTPELREERLPARMPLPQLVNLRSGEYRRLTRQTAAARASRAMWRRNAAAALANVMGRATSSASPRG